jgi:hypothetical protein
MKKRSGLLGLAFLMTWSTACLDPEAAGPEEVDGVAARTHQPFHVAVFDHAPTEAELAADLAQHLAAARGDTAISNLEPDDFELPGAGHKLVRISATTSDISNAGTDDPTVSFVGVWKDFENEQYTEIFHLDNDDVDDLNRDTVSVFYYLLNVGEYASDTLTDKFLKGQVVNTGTDGWHCRDIALEERNDVGTTRTQSLGFNQWVDAPSKIESSWASASNTNWLSY